MRVGVFNGFFPPTAVGDFFIFLFLEKFSSRFRSITTGRGRLATFEGFKRQTWQPGLERCETVEGPGLQMPRTTLFIGDYLVRPSG